MKVSETALRELVVRSRICGIALDTSAYHRNGLQFSEGLLPRLEQFKDSEVSVLVPDIVSRELRRHLFEKATEVELKGRAAVKKIGRQWGTDAAAVEKLLSELTQGRTVDALVSKKLDDYFKLVSAQEIASKELVDVERLLDLYFKVQPPFENSEQKKKEFPDAIALLALEKWAIKAQKIVLIVSADNGWLNFADASDHLIAVKELSHALNLFQDESASHRLRTIIRTISRGDPYGIRSSIKRALEDQAESIDFEPEFDSYFDVEDGLAMVTHEKMGEEVLADERSYELVESDEDTLSVSILLPSTYEVTWDFSFSRPDSVDGDSISLGTDSISKMVSIVIPITFTLVQEGGGYEADAIRMGRVRATVKFGEVQPAWMDEEL